MMKLRFVGTLALMAIGTQHMEAQASDSALVRHVATGIIAADNERDLERVLAYYADDAVLIPPSANPVMGIVNIRPRYEALFRDFDPTIEMTIHEVVVSGDLAYIRGVNGGVLRARHGSTDRVLNDVYLMVLRRSVEGAWKITRLMWHNRRLPGAASTILVRGGKCV